MKRVEIKQFDNRDEQIKWLMDNRDNIASQRKCISKEADAISIMSFAVDERGEQVKADSIPENATSLKVRVIINTTGLLDSHSDVHIPGIWKKSLQESKIFYHVQEHQFNYLGIISDKVKAFTKDYSWSDLKAPFEGSTQALVFESVIEKDRLFTNSNQLMFENYRKGFVRNHSVQMRYVKDFFCVNSDSYPDQLENWNKYIKYVANKEAAEAQNYFWAVTEAKIIEGSAVVRGSNWVTPTEIVQENKDAAVEVDTVEVKNEPTEVTQTEQRRRRN